MTSTDDQFPVYVWTGAPAFGPAGTGERRGHFFALPEDVAEHWLARKAVQDATTWGGVREMSPQVYEELVQAGESPAQPGERARPDDAAPFDALSALTDDDRPPSIHRLTFEHLPRDIIDGYASVWQAPDGSTCAAIPAENQAPVIQSLADRGCILREMPRLTNLITDDA